MVIYVNIYNEGMIPWLNKKGPLISYPIAIGAYELLKRDPRVHMELATKSNTVAKKEETNMNSKIDIKDALVIEKVEKEEISEISEINTNEIENDNIKEDLNETLKEEENNEIEIFEEELQNEYEDENLEIIDDSFDSEIDELLDDIKEAPSNIGNITKDSEKIKTYTHEELELMTKNK